MTAQDQEWQLDLGLDTAELFPPPRPAKRLHALPPPQPVRPALPTGPPSCGHPAPPWTPPGRIAIRCPTCCADHVEPLLAAAGEVIGGEAGRPPKLTGSTPDEQAAAVDARRSLLAEIERSVAFTTAAAFETDAEPAQTRLRIVNVRGLLHRAVALRETAGVWWLAQQDAGLPSLRDLPHATVAEVVLDAELAAALAELAGRAEQQRQHNAADGRVPGFRLPTGWARNEAVDAVRRAWARARGERPDA